MTEKSNHPYPCLVVGAGISGLLAARHLQDNSIRTLVLDKGRGVGGRMATRKIGKACFDHGAQVISARHNRIKKLIGKWQMLGLIKPWGDCDLFDPRFTCEKKLPGYCGTHGMTTLAKYLAIDLNVMVNKKVTRLIPENQTWKVQTEDGGEYQARVLVLSSPVPQSLELLKNSNIEIPKDKHKELQQLDYERCLTLMALFDKTSRIPVPGALRLHHGNMTWISDNNLKGICPEKSPITIQASPEFSRKHWESQPEKTVELLLDAAREYIDGEPTEWQLHNWHYSQAIKRYPESYLYVNTPLPLVFIGDAFGPGQIEGAALSGIELAESLKYCL